MTAVAIRRVQAKGLVEKTFDAAMVRLRLPLRTTVASLISIKQAPSTVVMLGISASYLSEVPVRLRTMATYLVPSESQSTGHHWEQVHVHRASSLHFELNLAFQSLSSS
jgi:hypothetical protein